MIRQSYKDVILKTEYYRGEIVKILAMSGSIQESDIQNRLSNIDFYLSIFKHLDAHPGELMDVDSYNSYMRQIEQDFKIIYEILREEMEESFEYFKNYVLRRLDDLKREARRFNSRIKIEAGSSILGKTLLQKNHGFDTFEEGNHTYIGLGSIEVEEGSLVAFLAKGEGILPTDYTLILNSEDEKITVPAYNYMQDSVRIPGSSTYKDHVIEVRLDGGNIKINTQEKGIMSDRIITFYGSDRISNESTLRVDSTEYISKESGNTYFNHPASGVYSFYLVGGTYIEVKSSSHFENTNLPQSGREGLKEVEAFFFEPKEEGAIEIKSDGVIYGRAHNTIQNDGSIIIDGFGLMEEDSVTVREVLPGPTRKYEAALKVNKNGMEDPELDSIIIKQLTMMEEFQNDTLQL